MIKIVMIIYVVFLVGYCKCSCERKESELLTVIGVFRHGDKTPKSEYFDMYPNNPWSNPKLWNHSDYASVTHVGKWHAYNRGKWLRERYAKFLPEKYSHENIHVKASDSDRVLVSTQLLLAGLFPPKGTDVWNDELIWQPIPVHTISNDNDAEVAQTVPCSKFSKLLEKQLKLEGDHFEDVKHLEKYTGKKINSLEDIYKLFELLKIVKENGMAIPTWARKAMPTLKNITDKLCKMYSITPEMQRFTTGPLLHTFINHFDAILSKSHSTSKMLLFGGHSRTLTNLLMTLDAFTEQPPYMATLLFELKKNCNGTPVIDVYYQTNTNVKCCPKQIIKNMPYKQFKDQMQPMTIGPTAWHNECRTGFIFKT